jgi:hypothetical protein
MVGLFPLDTPIGDCVTFFVGAATFAVFAAVLAEAAFPLVKNTQLTRCVLQIIAVPLVLDFCVLRHNQPSVYFFDKQQKKRLVLP